MMMTTYTISTDAVMTQVDATDADDAARLFAASEPTYAGCETADDLAARAEELGGWARVVEA